jgi:hypothetical protein
MKLDSATLQKLAAALTAILGVITAYGLLTPGHAAAVTTAIAAVAAIWQPTVPPTASA